MIHLKSIDIKNFKGVAALHCDFDDFTLLAGLNNSGKTTVLQAVYLLFASLPRVINHDSIAHANPSVRTISLQSALSPLGLRDTTWLNPFLATDLTGTVHGVFSNDLELELGMIRNSPNNLAFTITSGAAEADEIRQILSPIADISAAILTPPGDVPTREVMLNGDDYQNRLREGQGAQLWRNGLWWSIQADGPERFSPVQQQVQKYFPDIELLLPTLTTTGNTEILIKYKEQGRGPLDIAQSGAGIRTFISLARMLEQSTAGILLLDEPDSHLHASQQSVIVDLMLDAASVGNRQVIIASHSPEIIRRVPSECLRWVERSSATATGGYELTHMLEQLGAAAETYVPSRTLPDVLVYVEGIKDRPLLEALIRWCRNKSSEPLPTTLVIPHRDGRFEGQTLQGIARFAREVNHQISVVGIRDLDWYYSEIPNADPELVTSDGWRLLTLPSKEFENLFCDVEILQQAYKGRFSRDELSTIVDELSNSQDLVDAWRFQVRPRIRDRLPASLDNSTKEQMAEETFSIWQNDADVRRRLVAGKSLLGKLRQSIHQRHGVSFYPSRVFEAIDVLSPSLQAIASAIFPATAFR